MAIPPRNLTEKDTFHNLIFGIDKRFIFYIINPRTLIKLSLSKGGGGWRKTFKVFPIKILSPRRKFSAVSLSDLLGYFKGLPQKQISLRI